MNKDNLHELINRYEANLDMLNGKEHDELFKWKAMKTWRDEWFKPKTAFSSFADRFNAARRDFNIFIDNKVMHPSNGVIKLWEKNPGEVERLFREVLFADAQGDVSTVQNNMDRFLEECETLRCKYFPSNWSYKQTRHSASVFLAMDKPDFNYVYMSGKAMTMAKYIDFESPIGTGQDFSLPNYYRMCDGIVEVLKEHSSLLDKHFGRLTPEHYEDESLHLLAFDLMYCCYSYKFYDGLTAPSTGKTIRKEKKSRASQESAEQHEKERLEKISEIESQIEEAEHICDEFEDISLVGVQVTAIPYGVGIVAEQDANKIKVQFSGIEKTFVLDERYPNRPRFEDDEQIVAAFTEYGRALEQIKRLRRELEVLQKRMPDASSWVKDLNNMSIYRGQKSLGVTDGKNRV